MADGVRNTITGQRPNEQNPSTTEDTLPANWHYHDECHNLFIDRTKTTGKYGSTVITPSSNWNEGRNVLRITKAYPTGPGRRCPLHCFKNTPNSLIWGRFEVHMDEDSTSRIEQAIVHHIAGQDVRLHGTPELNWTSFYNAIAATGREHTNADLPPPGTDTWTHISKDDQRPPTITTTDNMAAAIENTNPTDPRIHGIAILRERLRTPRRHGNGDEDALKAEIETNHQLTNLELDMANHPNKLTPAKRKAT